MEEPNDPEVALRPARVINVPGHVGSRWEQHAAQDDLVLARNDGSGTRIRAKQFHHASEIILQAIEPRRLGIPFQPRHLTSKVSESVGVKSEASRHRGRSARSGPPSSQPATSGIEDRLDVRLARLAYVAGLDLLPGRPGLGSLPFFRRAELGAILELGKVLIEENPCGGGDLEPPLLGVRSKAPALRCRHLDAQRADPFGPDSGFHYHALYHGRGLRAVAMKKKPSASAIGVPSSARRNEP